MKTRLECFWDKVLPEPNSGCWLWTGATHHSGHGIFSVNHRTLGAHRWAWIHYRGPIPDGLYVCHKCDVPPCVNPDHLFLGTQLDNLQDMAAKGRGCLGEKNGRSTLTRDQVIEIKLSSDNAPVIAMRYGIHRNSVYRIKSGERWGHL